MSKNSNLFYIHYLYLCHAPLWLIKIVARISGTPARIWHHEYGLVTLEQLQAAKERSEAECPECGALQDCMPDCARDYLVNELDGLVQQCGYDNVESALAALKRNDLTIDFRPDHFHPGPECRYLGVGLWDCGVTDQH